MHDWREKKDELVIILLYNNFRNILARKLLFCLFSAFIALIKMKLKYFTLDFSFLSINLDKFSKKLIISSEIKYFGYFFRLEKVHCSKLMNKNPKYHIKQNFQTFSVWYSVYLNLCLPKSSPFWPVVCFWLWFFLECSKYRSAWVLFLFLVLSFWLGVMILWLAQIRLAFVVNVKSILIIGLLIV